MGEGSQRSSFWTGTSFRQISLLLLAVQYTSFATLLHYSRVMPAVGGKRYLTSTAVFLNEVIKLALSLTVALYEVSRKAPPSMPATSLFSSLCSAIFAGDSWKMVVPAILYTLANSLQYIALSNLEPASFQVTYQVKLFWLALFGLFFLRRSVPLRRWAVLIVLAVGVALVQLLKNAPEDAPLRDERAHLYYPRSLEEWKKMGGAAAYNLRKRSATYEGIEEDLLLEHPHFNTMLGLLATLGSCTASAFAGSYFEKVLRDSASSSSLWVRNVQLAIYSIFPALFIGVVFLDGEKIANQGFFDGYNWAVWSTIAIQSLGGIAAAVSITDPDRFGRNSASALSVLLSTFTSMWFFDLKLTSNFVIGTGIVLIALYFHGAQGTSSKSHGFRPPPIRVENFEKEGGDTHSRPNDFSIKLPNTPLLSAGLSTSRPTTPTSGHARGASSRNASGTYFPNPSGKP